MRLQNNNKRDDADVKKAFIKLFNSKEGEIVLFFLKKMTLDRFLGPDATDAELRHLEGQRHLVSYILSQSYEK